MQKSVEHRSAQRLAERGFGNAYLLLVLTMLFWAGNSVVARGVTDLVPPLTLAWLRWSIAAAIIWPFAWPHFRRDLPLVRRHWPILLLLGMLGAGMFISLYYVGLSKTTAINGLIINSAVPILIPVAVYVLYRETLTSLQAAGIALSLTGVLTVLMEGDPSVLLTLAVNEGDLWVLAAMSVWAMYTALLRKQPGLHWLSFAAICFTIAATINLPLALTETAAGREVQLTPHSLLAIAYVSTFPSLLAQIFYIRSVELIGGSRAGIFMHLIPIFGVILAILFLGETLYMFHVAGFLLVFCGVWLASRPVRTSIGN